MPIWGPIIGAGIGAAGSLISGAMGADAAEDAGDAAAKADLQAAAMADRYARETRDLGLAVTEPYREAATTALSAMMDMAGLPRSVLSGGGYTALGTNPAPTSASTDTDYTAAGQGSGTPRAYPPPPNSWRGTPEDWFKVVDGWYSDPAGTARLNSRATVNGVNLSGWMSGRTISSYISNRVNDFWQGLQENVNSDNVATLLDPNTKLPVPYYGGGGSLISGGFNPSVSAGDQYQYDASRIGAGSRALESRPQYDWQTSPSYEWRFNEGVRAQDASAAAAGMLMSGGHMANLTEYGQGMATQEYDSIWNRLASIAGMGQVGTQGAVTAIGQGGAIGAGGSQFVSGAGASRASGLIGASNAWSNAIDQTAQGIGYAISSYRPRPSSQPGGQEYAATSLGSGWDTFWPR